MKDANHRLPLLGVRTSSVRLPQSHRLGFRWPHIAPSQAQRPTRHVPPTALAIEADTVMQGAPGRSENMSAVAAPHTRSGNDTIDMGRAPTSGVKRSQLHGVTEPAGATISRVSDRPGVQPATPDPAPRSDPRSPSVAGESTETIRPRFSVLLAVLTAIQALLPTVVAVICLGAIVTLYGEIFDLRAPEVVIMAILCLFLVRLPAHLTEQLRSPPLHTAVRLFARWLMLLLALAAIEPLIRGFGTFHNARAIVLTWAAFTPLMLVAAVVAVDAANRRLLRDVAEARTCVFVGYNEMSEALSIRLARTPSLYLKPIGFFDDRNDARLGLGGPSTVAGKLSDLAAFAKVHRVDVIFISLPARQLNRVAYLVDELQDTTASIYYLPDVFVFDLIQARAGQIAGVPVIALLESPISGYGVVMKRLFDVCVATLMLIVAAPLLAVVSALIKATSPGPVLFWQRRYGLDGAEILVYKFRTMRAADDGPVVNQATRDDPRVTTVGRFLRRTSIDELPQLLNVLQGSMSLVGPRPHAVAHNEQYRRLIKGYMLRHKVLPGITGLAQVNGARGETARLEDMQMRIMHDLDYLRRWSPALDVKIMLLTVWRALRDKKAY